jgi:hypothetical protein
MAGSYYNGYMKTPRRVRQPKFRLSFVDTGLVGGGERHREETYIERADLDAKIAVLARCEPAGSITQVTVERWKRGTGWVVTE